MTQALGWARRPMLERIHLLPRELPITLIYGAESWIDTSTGRRVRELRPHSYVRHLAIAGASHHVYADQPAAFNAAVQEICDSVD
ncbi:(Lyso)-N-acylphosphatidylethanolamine lipase-like [Chelonoidis abingdonii]